MFIQVISMEMYDFDYDHDMLLNIMTLLQSIYQKLFFLYEKYLSDKFFYFVFLCELGAMIKCFTIVSQPTAIAYSFIFSEKVKSVFRTWWTI